MHKASPSSLKCWLLIIVACYLSVACIPGPDIEYDNPFSQLKDQLLKGSTTRDHVQQILGVPVISNHEWRIDVYSDYGKVAYTMIPMPMYATDSEPYYALVTYDENDIVENYDAGATHVKLDGFDYWGYDFTDEHYLLAPRGADNAKYLSKIPSNKCVVYFLPDGGEKISFNRKYFLTARVGIYFRWVLLQGEYQLSIQTNFVTVDKALNCEPGKTLYAHATRKYFWPRKPESGQKGQGYEINVTNVEPEEISRRQLVIYPELPDGVEAREYRAPKE